MQINLFETCSNISYLTIKGEFDDVAYYPKFINFSNIKTIKVKVHNLKNPIIISKIINIISSCQNLLTLIFNNNHFDFGNAYGVFPILMHITTKELRKIICYFDVNNIHLDFDPIIERFPKLESIILSTDYRMNYMHMYQLYPFFMSNHLFELDYPNLVRLCERAKKNNNNKRISLGTGNNSSILNYLQYHSEILKRIKNIKVHSPNYIPLHFSIDYLQYYIINRNCDIHLLLHFK